MKTGTFLHFLIVIAGLTCGCAIQAVAQGGSPGGGMRGMPLLSGALTQEQRNKLNDAITAEMTKKLNDAQKAAVTAALDKNATADSIKAKIDAVAKIQTEIAIAKFKVFKTLTLTDEQMTAMEINPGAWNQIFGSGSPGSTRLGGTHGGGPGGAAPMGF